MPGALKPYGPSLLIWVNLAENLLTETYLASCRIPESHLCPFCEIQVAVRLTEMSENCLVSPNRILLIDNGRLKHERGY
jgi:hypothetical protein